MIISDFQIKCANGLNAESRFNYYKKGTCDYEFGLKSEEGTVNGTNDGLTEPDDDHLKDREGHILLIVAVTLAGFSIFALILVVICACLQALREGREDHPIDDLDLCPGCSAACANCSDACPDCSCNCDGFSGYSMDNFVDVCAGKTLEVCFGACLEAACQACCSHL